MVFRGLALLDAWMPALVVAWLVLGALAWRWLQPCSATGQHAARRLSALPLAVAAVCLLVFAVLAWVVVYPEHAGHAGLMAADAWAQQWAQDHVSAPMRDVLHVLTAAGDVRWLAALVLLVAGCLVLGRQWQALWVWVFFIGLNGLAVRLLKNLLDRARPEVLHALATSGASFPSGHTAGAVVVYGLLWLVLRGRLSPAGGRMLAWLCGGLVLVIAMSRILLQAHFASDVLAGALLGLALCALAALALCLAPMSAAAHPPISLSERLALYLDLIRFKRPAGWLVLVWPTLVALWAASGGFPGWHLVLVFVLGTFLMRSAGCCINDIADRKFDRHVKRTAQRPITTGKISVFEAAMVGVVLTLLSLGLVLTTRWEAVAWSVPAVLFTILYPFTKRFFAMPQAFLGIAFNFGVLIAFAAVQGQVPLMAWLLWLANMCMVLAYDTEYAMVDRDDDLKIGMKTSAITLGRFDVAAIMAFFVVCLGLTVLALAPLQLAWPWWLGVAVAALQMAWHYRLIRQRTREGCFTAFSKSHWIGVSLFVGVLLALAL